MAETLAIGFFLAIRDRKMNFNGASLEIADVRLNDLRPGE